jgi:hypothetical protein
MYCPDCGTENTSTQRFCRQCGSNLTSVKLAREVINTPADAGSHIDPSTVFKVVALISILGFLFITGGAIALTAIQTTWEGASQHQPPIGLFLALFGYGSLILIDRQLLKFVGPASSRRQRMSAETSPRPAVQAAPGSTRSLVEGAPFGSVTEPTTRQFQEEQRR